VLDAGTGIRTLTGKLDGRPFVGSILLSHLHWDHVQGIPFFVAADRDDSRVSLYVPAQDGRTGEELLRSSMSPPAFPITPAGLKGDWAFNATEPGVYRMEGFQVTAAEVRHKGGRTFGYRVSDGSASIAYLPDHMASGGPTPELATVAGGVDLLMHDAQFMEREREWAEAYGHSTVDDAIRLAEQLEVGRLLLIHHGPGRTDGELDSIAAALSAKLPVTIGAEGAVLAVGSTRNS